MTHADDVVAKQHIADLLREAVAQRDGKQASLFGGRTTLSGAAMGTIAGDWAGRRQRAGMML
jgi:hypothetical protein